MRATSARTIVTTPRRLGSCLSPIHDRIDEPADNSMIPASAPRAPPATPSAMAALSVAVGTHGTVTMDALTAPAPPRSGGAGCVAAGGSGGRSGGSTALPARWNDVADSVAELRWDAELHLPVGPLGHLVHVVQGQALTGRPEVHALEQSTAFELLEPVPRVADGDDAVGRGGAGLSVAGGVEPGGSRPPVAIGPATAWRASP